MARFGQTEAMSGMQEFKHLPGFPLLFNIKATT